MKRIKLEGKRFGRLLVLNQTDSIGGATAYECRCDCGTTKKVRGVSLRKGDTTSCGCARAERMAAHQYRHGYYKTRTYNSWRAMLARCSDPKHRQYKDYGGRGITVCQQWKEFERFLADMGERPPGRSIDRIDGDGNYEPGNCRWATRTEQNRNRRNIKRSSP